MKKTMSPTHLSLVLASLFLALTNAQTPNKTPENHPKLQTYQCTKSTGCKPQTSRLVLDEMTHPIHQLSAPSLPCTNLTSSSSPNSTICPDALNCAKNCVIEGITDYTPHGVQTSGSSLSLSMLENGTSVSPRVYLLDEEGKKYDMLKLTGKEFTFDVDVSKLPCGMNGALYLSEMEADGGASKSSESKTGAAYGSGYCDAQCYVPAFLNGQPNVKSLGACCNEMDIWEANNVATSIAPHVCNQTSFYGCSGAECGFNGVCDQWGCSYNPYGQGNKDYYGPGLKVDTRRPFTVVTQFPTSNTTGKLTAIRRLYVQDGKVIKNAAVNITGTKAFDEVDTEYCSRPGGGTFMSLGGVEAMGDALGRVAAALPSPPEYARNVFYLVNCQGTSSVSAQSAIASYAFNVAALSGNSPDELVKVGSSPFVS
ncbi:hypothetical protein G7Y89_g3409 [Cudoniella acicularis]|uniref:Glucanase n=1 Tax=Cudoniella acicularis TaxID=354080 RepID=A0A8H4RRF6_9HELO|nr:hypothetical protein G7Y89_g3409 [Cudoniella acicularis]